LFPPIWASEFDRVFGEELACKIWEKLKVAHATY
jgi:hypothetical protein